VAVGQQPARADRLAVEPGERVQARGIHGVHLDLARHALLLDEDLQADAARFGARGGPVQDIDSQHRAKV